MEIAQSNTPCQSSGVYPFSIKKALTTKTHETTRSSITNFMIFIRVFSCVFVVPVFAVENELTLRQSPYRAGAAHDG
jgi:hypothetical protein